MNPKQFYALVKLRMKLFANQARKAGKFNYYLSIGLIGLGILASLMSFFFGLGAGILVFDDSSSNMILITWNVIALGFLFFWTIGLLTELQQTELLSLDKLLHLPISLQGAFVLNYMSCFLNTSFILVVPGMFGLAIGMVISLGPHMLLSLLLMLGFLFLISALTYQLRGWLSRLMTDKRKKGNAIALVTLIFVGLSQVPHLVTRNLDKRSDQQRDVMNRIIEEENAALLVGISAEIEHGNATLEEYDIMVSQMQLRQKLRKDLQVEKTKSERMARRLSLLQTIDRYFPLGWMPLGITRISEGRWQKPMLAFAAFVFTGLLSLTVSYRADMRKYTGTDTGRRRKKVKQDKTDKQIAFLYHKIPYTNDHVSAVAFSSLKSLIRSPEAKMMLILPMLVVMFGGFFWFNSSEFSHENMPRSIIPWISIGAIGAVMFMLSGFMFNLFGMDRDGFRAYLLAPISRSDLLLGKNLSMVPIVFLFCLLLIVGVQMIAPVGSLLFLALIVQIPIIFLYFCLLGNYFSIGFPMGIKRGTMQPQNPKVLAMLALMLSMTIGMGLLMAPTSLAFGIPFLIEVWTDQEHDWMYLVLSLVQLALAIWLYTFALKHQASWLWNRETKVLQEVANIPE